MAKVHGEIPGLGMLRAAFLRIPIFGLSGKAL